MIRKLQEKKIRIEHLVEMVKILHLDFESLMFNAPQPWRSHIQFPLIIHNNDEIYWWFHFPCGKSYSRFLGPSREAKGSIQAPGKKLLARVQPDATVIAASKVLQVIWSTGLLYSMYFNIIHE